MGATATPAASARDTASGLPRREPRVFMMDLLATVPYYTAYLSRALLAYGVPVQIGSITYYLDPQCFRSRGLSLQPGALDVVGKFSRLPRVLRQGLKLVETSVNLFALTLRFLLSPPDIVHIQYLPMLRLPFAMDAWFVRFCRWRGSRLLLTVHDLLPHDSADRFRPSFTQLYASMDVLICHSDHVRERLLAEFAIPDDRIHVIPHGPFFFDLPGSDAEATRKRFSITGSDTMVLWQGIIFPYKGLDLLLAAWREVEQQQSRAHLVVVGTGSAVLVEALRAQADELKLARVHFDFRFCSAEELVAAYRAADLVVYPYRAITTSGALATGLALGKTIVASDLPVFRELLIDGENARLVDPLNVAELARAINELLRDTGLRERLSQAVQAMHFGTESWLKIAATTASVYRKMLDNTTNAELHT